MIINILFNIYTHFIFLELFYTYLFHKVNIKLFGLGENIRHDFGRKSYTVVLICRLTLEGIRSFVL